jgi:hypothetical protein
MATLQLTFEIRHTSRGDSDTGPAVMQMASKPSDLALQRIDAFADAAVAHQT